MSLLRRIRPQLQDYDRDDEHMSDASSVQSIGEDKDAAEDDDGDSEDSEDSEEGSEAEVANAQETLSKITFGVLAKAQKSLSKDRINPSLSSKEDRIAAVKSRLAEINSSSASWKDAPKDPNKWKTREELKRASKNAPQEVSSKRAVTRKRTVVDPLVSAAQKARDPRFDAAVTGTFDERRFRKNYSFLDDYRGDEIKSMKEEMAKSKDERKKEELKKTVFSMESKILAQKNKDRAEELASERKKKENDLVKQGKKPFYLKKAEQKKALLVDKYSKFNEKQLDKVMEKKRKRKSQKEKKNMPWSRRVE